ncbi:uncharacterized protein LOC125045479 [Penaeus chinensis]|uniref:uncharacterized protein LOC125045479 n=1 Tax=Penaeus chinensis TaxID=139456 RepID=UPI001FB6355F|nr:uncharacterized protein LOC125045479 [Penaeus chinensis]
MRALALSILVVTLALGHALPYRKGFSPLPNPLQLSQGVPGPKGPPLVPKEQESLEASGEGDSEDDDDLKDDPDWVPTAEDYEDAADDDDGDYSYEYYEDYIVEPDYNEEEDELWSSDDDPDWLPEGVSEEDSHNDDEDELWSSDEDPDWEPEDHSNEESSEEVSQTSAEDKIGNLDQDLVQELAEAMVMRAEGQGTLEDMIKLIVSLNLTREEALEALDGLYKIIADDQAQGQSKEQEPHPNDLDQTRPEIPRPSPESESFSKRPLRQYKGQYSQQQDQYRQADQLDLAHGVEPLSPGSQGRVDVGLGVEPVVEEDDGYSFGDWLANTWDAASDKVEDLGDRAEDTFRGIGHSISGAVETAVDKVQETAHAAGEHIVSTYEKAKEKLAILKERLAVIFTKLGVTIQVGAEYCFQKLAHAVDQVRSNQVLDKLEQELQKGNEQVSKFFSVLGQKITAWKAEHPDTDIDAGLVIHHGQQEGQGDQLGYNVDETHGEQTVPEFFWDQQVVDELDKLVEQGTLTQDELQVFPLQQSTQGYARERRERMVRSWVDSLRHFA